MNVALFGGTGFVGGYIVDALISAGHTPAVMVRKGSEHKLRQANKCAITVGSIASTDAIEATMAGCDAAIFNIGILRENPSEGITFVSLQYDALVKVLAAAKKVGVQRLLLMSANGVEARSTAYQDSKWRAEEAALNSDLDVTVFAPSVIFGHPRGNMEFATQLLRDMVRPPLPAVGFYTGLVPNSHSLPMSPVHVKDVAAAFCAALDNLQTIGQRYVLAGPDTVSWTQILQTISAAYGRKKWIIPMPVAAMKLVARLLDWVPSFPVTHAQLTMLEQGNTGTVDEIEELIERPARNFNVKNLEYLREHG